MNPTSTSYICDWRFNIAANLNVPERGVHVLSGWVSGVSACRNLV